MYNVGIIGCGGISSDHHDGLTATGRAQVTRVYDTDSDLAAGKAGKWGATQSGSAEELVSGVDIVVIATPGFAHREYVQRAAAEGRHILVEKPIALNLDDALAMRDAVESAGIVCQVGFVRHFAPAFAQLKEMSGSGQLGGLVSAWAHNYAPASSARWRDIEASGHWRSSMELSGGRINEFCSHDINWLLWILGRPETVYGRALYTTEGFGLDDADYALIECERGTGLLEVCRHAGVPDEQHYGVMGHGGSAIARGGGITLTLMDKKPREIPVDIELPTKHEHFLNCIETGEKPVTNMDDAIDTLRVCLAFNRSAKSGNVEQAR